LNTNNIGALFVAIIVILTMVIVGVMVYFDIAETGQLPQQSQLFADTNTSNTTHTLTYAPRSSDAAYFSGMWYNDSSLAWTAIPSTNLTLVGRQVTFIVRVNNTGVANPVYHNLSQINITYYTQVGAVVNDDVTPGAEIVFTLAPVVAIVAIAGLMLFAVGGFGKRESF
jgi:hypothetical protein